MATKTIKPNKKNIRTWIEALRSGEYKQSTRYLKTLDGYCCLGVACDLYKKDKKRGRWDRENYFVTGKSDNKYHLPGLVQQWLGILDRNPTLDSGLDLETLNDHGKTFKQIARAIERQWLK